MTVPASPSTPRTSDKEARILRAAIEVFAERGYHASRIAHVAERAGVATGTIYLYFAKKPDLLVRLFQRTLSGVLDRSAALLRRCEPGMPRLRKLIELHLAFFAGDRALSRVFQIHVRDPDPGIREGIQPTFVAYFGVIEDVVQDGIDAGAFAPDLDVRLSRRVVFGALDEVVTSWLRGKRERDLMDDLEPVARMLSRAVGAAEEPRV